MGILFDDVVIMRKSEKEEEPSVITVNCPDKTGLGCDLCRIILFFGLSIVRVDVSTDGKWCYLVFWVIGKPSTRWSLLKKRMVDACPSCSCAILLYSNELHPPKPPDVFLLKLCCFDRRGLLHDVIEVLCELEFVIKKVKVSTTPDGKAVHLLFVTDTRELLHTERMQLDTSDHLQEALGNDLINCDIQMVGPEVAACSQGPSFLPHEITDGMLNMEMLDDDKSGFIAPENLSITIDNKLSPAHTLLQIVCRDHKGLLYDIMRTLKDYNIQVSYGRFTMKRKTECELDLFVMQADGKKLAEPSKQRALCSRLGMELCHPLRVALVSRGPDTELLVANPVELSGKGRPLVFHDITLAFKMLNIGIFSAEIGRHMIGDREWEVYRVLLDEGDGFSVSRDKIELCLEDVNGLGVIGNQCVIPLGFICIVDSPLSVV